MTTEKALEQLQNSLKKLDIDYSVIQSEKDVKISTRRASISVDCWFNSQQQTFGFTLASGGIKSYTNIEEFEHYFEIYLNIYTVFIPRAKRIADTFEKTEDIQTMYNSFKGSEASGYHALFNVVGNDLTEVVVSTTEKKNIYKLRYISKVNSKDKGEVVADYEYKITDDGDAIFLPSMKTYIAELATRYNQDGNIDIERTGKTECTYLVNDRLITATVVIDDDDIQYLVTKYIVAGDEVELKENIKVTLDDCYDIYKLAEVVQAKVDLMNDTDDTGLVEEADKDEEEGFDFAEEQSTDEEDFEFMTKNEGNPKDEEFDFSESEAETEKNQDTPEEVPLIEAEPEPNTETETESEADTKTEADTETTSEPEAEAENTVSTTPQASQSLENDEKVKVTDQEEKIENEAKYEADTDLTNENETLKIVMVNGKAEYFRIDKGNTIFDIPADLVDIPQEIVEEKVEKHKHKGMFITDEERKRRIFAKIITDTEQIKQLLDDIFD